MVHQLLQLRWHWYSTPLRPDPPHRPPADPPDLSPPSRHPPDSPIRHSSVPPPPARPRRPVPPSPPDGLPPDSNRPTRHHDTRPIRWPSSRPSAPPDSSPCPTRPPGPRPTGRLPVGPPGSHRSSLRPPDRTHVGSPAGPRPGPELAVEGALPERGLERDSTGGLPGQGASSKSQFAWIKIILRSGPHAWGQRASDYTVNPRCPHACGLLRTSHCADFEDSHHFY